jgi:hypothetical protein
MEVEEYRYAKGERQIIDHAATQPDGHMTYVRKWTANDYPVVEYLFINPNRWFLTWYTHNNYQLELNGSNLLLDLIDITTIFNNPTLLAARKKIADKYSEVCPPK